MERHTFTAGHCHFPTTSWSRLARAVDSRDPARGAALQDLALAYWYPLYAFVRRQGHAPDEAADLTQGFFADLLERGTLTIADPHRGRFRSFLLAACRHYLSHERERGAAFKRGGGLSFVSIDGERAERRFGVEPAHEQTAERLFMRAWALEVLRIALERLRIDETEAGRSRLLDQLGPTLTDGRGTSPYGDVAAALGMSVPAVKMAASRLRKRYRALVREEVARTVETEDDVDDEVRDLFAALAG